MRRPAFRGSTRAAGLVAILSLLTVCTHPSSDWWTFQHDLGHTGFVRGGMGRSPKLVWNTSLVGGTVSLTPPVFGGIADTFRIFIGSGYGGDTLFALAPGNGSILWKFAGHPNNGFFGAPVAADSNVYTATLGATPFVYCVRQKNGALVWQTPLPSGTRASVTVGQGRVYVYSDDHKLRALSQATGAILWTASTTPTTMSQESSPALDSNFVYVGSDSGLHAFNALTGAFLWMYPTNGITGFSSPVIQPSSGGTIVVIGDNSGRLHAVNAQTGAPVWSYLAAATLAFGSAAGAQGRVFLFDFSNVAAVDVNAGALLWKQPAPLIPRHSPAIARDVLFYHDDQTVFGLNTGTGLPVWKAPVPGNGNPNSPGSEMAIALEMLLVPNKGHLHAFR